MIKIRTVMACLFFVAFFALSGFGVLQASIHRVDTTVTTTNAPNANAMVTVAHFALDLPSVRLAAGDIVDVSGRRSEQRCLPA